MIRPGTCIYQRDTARIRQLTGADKFVNALYWLSLSGFFAIAIVGFAF